MNRMLSCALGLPSLIQNDSYTTTIPAECDDAQFDVNSSILPPLSGSDVVGRDNTYSVLRCRLTHLIKMTTCPRVGVDSTEPPAAEILQRHQADIHNFLSELPPALRLDVSPFSPSSPSPSSPDDLAMASSSSPALEPPPPPPRAAAAALSLLGHGRILEMMLPAARRDSIQQQAMFASVDAACRVGSAARILLGGAGVGGGGGCLKNYLWMRGAWVGAVWCAGAILRDGTAMWAQPARDAVRDTLAVFGGRDCPGEKVLRFLQSKGRAGGVPPPRAGEKRKRPASGDGSGGVLGDGEILPFVGMGVCFARSGLPTPTPSQPDVPTSRPAATPSRRKEKERDGKGRPQIAVRVRGGAGADSKVKTEPSTPVVAREQPVPIRPAAAKPPSRRQSVSVVPSPLQPPPQPQAQQPQHEQLPPRQPTPQGYIAPPPQQQQQQQNYTHPPPAGLPPQMQPIEYVAAYDGSMYAAPQQPYVGAPPYAPPPQGYYYASTLR